MSLVKIVLALKSDSGVPLKIQKQVKIKFQTFEQKKSRFRTISILTYPIKLNALEFGKKDWKSGISEYKKRRSRIRKFELKNRVSSDFAGLLLRSAKSKRFETLLLPFRKREPRFREIDGPRFAQLVPSFRNISIWKKARKKRKKEGKKKRIYHICGRNFARDTVAFMSADISSSFDSHPSIHIFIANKFSFRGVAAGRWSLESIYGDRFRKSREKFKRQKRFAEKRRKSTHARDDSLSFSLSLSLSKTIPDRKTRSKQGKDASSDSDTQARTRRRKSSLASYEKKLKQVLTRPGNF